MNSLSWLIYLAEIVNNISGTLAALLSFGLFAMGVWFLLSFFSYHSEGEYPEWGIRPKALIYIIPLVLLPIIIPSKTTIYMIAASEIGEEAIHSGTMKKLNSIIQKKLDDMLDETIKEGGKSI